MSSHRLLHWNAPPRTEFLDTRVEIDERQIRVDVENDDAMNEGQSRSVIIEIRDNGTLAVLCYPRDRDDPVVIILNADGTYEVRDE